MRHLKFVSGLLLVALIGTSGIIYLSIESKENTLLLSTTTSVENSGLLDYLISRFQAENPSKSVLVTAVGTGAALEIGKRGDSDAVLVHAPDLEKEFLSQGYGVGRETLWYNYFILVGPETDPANISSAPDVITAMKFIYQSGISGRSVFVSRADNSGTHYKEQVLWNMTGLTPGGEWYVESGSGMSATLRATAEFEGYTLSDLGTFQALVNDIDLNALYQGKDDILYNPYSYIHVNPELHEVNNALSQVFLSFLINHPDLVADYTVNGEQLFWPVGQN